MRCCHLRSLALLLACLAGATAAASQSVIVVDAGGAGDFTVLQDAVDAAVAGDVILVRSAQWDSSSTTPTIIDAKGLTVVGEQGLPAVGAMLVRNLPAGATVTLRNLKHASNGFAMIAIVATDNLGTLVVEGSYAAGKSAAFLSSFAVPGLLATNCASVVLSGSTIEGGAGFAATPFSSSLPGAAALSCTNSRISAVRTNFHGGAGGPLGFEGTFGKPGGHAIDVDGGYLFLSGATVQGGANGECPSCEGSDGLHLRSGTVQFVQSVFEAGATPLGIPGQDIDAPSGSVQDLLDHSRVLAVTAPLHSFETGNLDYIGAPRDLVAFFVATSTDFLPVTGTKGVWNLGSPIAGPFLPGMADNDGHLLVPFTAPDVAPREGLTLFVQAVVREASGELRIGGVSALVVIDDSL